MRRGRSGSKNSSSGMKIHHARSAGEIHGRESRADDVADADQRGRERRAWTSGMPPPCVTSPMGARSKLKWCITERGKRQESVDVSRGKSAGPCRRSGSGSVRRTPSSRKSARGVGLARLAGRARSRTLATLSGHGRAVSANSGRRISTMMKSTPSMPPSPAASTPPSNAPRRFAHSGCRSRRPSGTRE